MEQRMSGSTFPYDAASQLPAEPAPEPTLSRSELTTLMAQIGQTLASEPLEVEAMVDRITTAAADSVPGAEHASIAQLSIEGDLEVLAETDPIASTINELQIRLRQGPRFDTAKAGQRWVSGDLANDDRWPELGPAVAELGIRSMLTTAIASEPKRVVLNLFSTRRDAFDPDDILVELFAHHARVALGYATELETLRRGLTSRTTIGEAIGIVMERFGMTEERSFDYLRRVSQNSNVKLRVVADNVVHGPDTDSSAAIEHSDNPIDKA